MGVENFYYKDMFDIVLPDLEKRSDKKVLCLGYPDMLVTEDLLTDLYGKEFVDTIPEDPLPDEVRAWHKSQLPKIFDPLWLLRHHGFDPVIFDGVVHRGFEEVVNLNEPLDSKYYEQFDLVIDTGTLEHCFNVGTAFKNVCQSIKKDGYFMTAAPITKLNHGYWNFGTIVYSDGFGWNGFEITQAKYLKQGEILPKEVINRQRIPLLSIAFIIAKRTEIKEWVWPIQGKYLK